MGEPDAAAAVPRRRPHEVVDDALRRLSRDAGVNIVPESNQKMLTDADRRAALHLGGQDTHLLAIGV